MRSAILALVFIGLPSLALPSLALAEFDIKSLERDALKGINAQRAQVGCPELRPNAALQSAATAFANAMAKQNFFSHKAPDGSTMKERVEAAGYRWRALAENIAAGQSTAADVVAAWMASPGHRANIQNCALRDTGLAVVYQPNDRAIKGKTYPMYYYWVQTFGSP